MSSAPRSTGPRPVVAALLAGGKGTRFWPASRGAMPKQFLSLVGGRSLLQGTFERFAGLLPAEQILVVTSLQYSERTRTELPRLSPENLLLEPSGRDTGPAAALAVLTAARRHGDPIVVLAPTDHLIEDQEAFGRALATGIAAAEDGALVTFGVVPDRPATVYGYIEVSERPASGDRALPVLRFREKPSAEDAAAFVASGRFFWNAGIFAWRASAFLAAIAEADPAFARAVADLDVTSASGGGSDPGAGSAMPATAPSRAGAADPATPEGQAFARSWNALPAISIDYLLMEKARNVRVVPLAAGWSDVGSWDAVRERLPRDAQGNRAAEDVLYAGASECSVHRAGAPARRKFIALAGTEGLVVVETDDALLICREGAGEQLREIVARLRALGREDLL